MSEILQSSADGRLLRVTLRRAEKRNALNAELCRELVNALERADADPGIGAVLLTSEGSAFSAGMDLNEVLSFEAAALGQLHEQLFTLNARLSTPVIAFVHGPALGGGVGLVANCHVVVASEAATFGLTEIRLGLWPFLVFRALSEAVGERRAVELSLTGRVFSAHEALNLGLIHSIGTYDTAERIARQLASHSPTAVRSGLMFVREARDRTWEQAGEMARQVREQIFRSPDFREGVRAFQEKREPKWPSLG